MFSLRKCKDCSIIYIGKDKTYYKLYTQDKTYKIEVSYCPYCKERNLKIKRIFR